MIRKNNSSNILLFLLFLIVGLYFLSTPFKIIPSLGINDWIIFAGGVLLIIGGIKYLRLNLHSSYGPNYGSHY
ncbi:hypothetical protein KAI04_01310 [Candidatus Pacearchaeota archaeon]|nr:hypothetical protein [Candidatus Pacearchaeota archaeon]